VRQFLDHGFEVTSLSRHEPDARTAELVDGARLVHGDAKDLAALRRALDGVAHVVDALGAPHPAASAAATPKAQFDAELPVLSGLLAELRNRRDVSLTFLSSGGAIYGNAAVLPVYETTDCHPVSPYGEAKLAAERLVFTSARDYGLSARILRVANAYGARQRARTGQGLVATMLRAAQTGEPVSVFGDGCSVRDYVDARDVAGAVVALRAHPRGPTIVNVGTSVGHRVLDVRAVVEQVTGSVLKLRHEPPRGTDVASVVLDVARLTALMDWNPRSLQQGVGEAWDEIRTVPALARHAVNG